MSSLTHTIASSLGASEAGLRLVLGQLAGYPLLFLYRRHLARQGSHLSLVEVQRRSALIGPELRIVACASNLMP